MKISREAEYGLRAMVLLAKSHASRQAGKKTLSVREISNIEKVPFEFLAKIFNKLEKANLVKAKRGASGGYLLAKPANKITPGDVIAVLEEELIQSHCSGCPMAGGCTSGQVLEEVHQSMDDAFNAVTLAKLAKK